MKQIEVQGHRGACGLLPENTLPSFEMALDLGVTSIETDVHLSGDDVVVIAHDLEITGRVYTLAAGREATAEGRPTLRSMTLQQIRGYRAGPGQPAPMPLAQLWAAGHGVDPYGIPTLAELLDFVQAYAAVPGEQAGKTFEQRERARRLIFDIELKSIPFLQPTGRGDLEKRVVEIIRGAGVVKRTRVRSFDHRCLRAVKQIEPVLQIGLLIHHTVPAQIGLFLESSQADLYCPDYAFVDADVVGQVHAAGKRIIPYSVNAEDQWARLCSWGVDGITTDFPDRLLQWLAGRLE